jgi:hypothetical protein
MNVNKYKSVSGGSAFILSQGIFVQFESRKLSLTLILSQQDWFAF